jgi:hypothetical protein
MRAKKTLRRNRRRSSSRKRQRGGWWGAGESRKTRVADSPLKNSGPPVAPGKQPAPGPSQCHPAVRGLEPQGCLPLEVLRRAASAAGLADAAGMDPGKLRDELAAKLGLSEKEGLGERSFLMALPGIAAQEKADLARRRLRPAMPAGWREDPDMWLDSNNIAEVMNQYEEAYPEFEFMGPFPIDFAAPDPYAGGATGAPAKKCLMSEICELRVQKALKNGTRAIGIVYNLDPHFKSGSHWVANYIDIPGHKCYYFDSYGMKPPPQVAKFMRWLTTQDPKMRLEYNSRRLQFSNTECGVYSIYFITRMLAGDSFQAFTRRRPKDRDMLDLRDWLFST